MEVIPQKRINEELIKTIQLIAYNARRIRMEGGFSEKQLTQVLQSSPILIRKLETCKSQSYAGRPEKEFNVPLIPTLLRVSLACNVCITEFFKPMPCQ